MLILCEEVNTNNNNCISIALNLWLLAVSINLCMMVVSLNATVSKHE